MAFGAFQACARNSPFPLAGYYCAKPEGVRGRIMEAGSLKVKVKR